MNIKLVYASLTGNTEMLSDLIIEKFEEEKGLEIEKLFIEDMVDFDFLDDADAFIIATYTYGEGDLPEEMEEFFEALGEKNFSGKTYGVIGTGDTVYEQFCVCVDQFNDQIAKTGATNPTQNLKIEIEADTDEDFENIDKFIEDFSSAL
ncbi:flavodoxin domain-containing protein [Gemella morbillorum]|uniref:flavodoxin domain-containing protein n=1 Tax=Gemella morbillorum TaxID=29391 RepID=UPI00248D54C8|nr:flavodoxin domain-containing protein [Gemella morbillorum]